MSPASGPEARELHRSLPRSDDLRHPPRWLLRAGRPAFAAFVRRRWRLEVNGARHVPAHGPVIVISNHMGWLDGPLMAIVGPRPVHALTKQEMFHGALGHFLHLSGQIPLHREAVDTHAVRLGLRVLREGGVVGMFPEGTRGDGSVERALGGSAYLALVSGAPVVPLVFLGTREYRGRNSSLPPAGSRLVMTYGAPHSSPRREWPRTPEMIRELAETHRQLLRQTLHTAQAATGMELPGPIPDREPLPKDFQ